MATLTASQLTVLRQGNAVDRVPIQSTKAQINTALQALEDWWEADGKLEAAAAIETAVPSEFTNPEKKTIGKWWLWQKFFLGG